MPENEGKTMIDLQLNAQPKTPATAFIRDTDEMRFEQDVLVPSMTKPVIVDFWTARSAPCRQMMPLLEKAVNAADGAVLMVRVDVDRNPQLAQALRIQTVPTVYAFFQGKPMDGFVGPKSEIELRGFVDNLKKLSGAAPAEADAAATAEQIKKFMAEADKFFQEGKLEEAMARYGAVLDMDTNNMDALGGIGWCLLSQGDAESVREMLSQLTPEQSKSPRLQGLQFILGLGDEANNIEALIDRLVAEVKKNREGPAKAQLLEIFGALGNAHPLTLPGRRKLSAVLFS